MNLYKISPRADYLASLADFIICNFKDNLHKLKVILPTGNSCNELLNIIIKKQNTSFLPATISFANILAEGEEIFKIPSEEITRVSYLEQKFILSKIIHDFDKLDLSLVQSLKFTDSLSNLFHELGCNLILIEQIKELSTATHAKHWQFIYEFLNYAYENLQSSLKILKKASHADYHNAMLNAEVSSLASGDNFILVAGMFGHDLITWQFLSKVASNSRGYIVLPPVPDFEDSVLEASATDPDEALYCLKQLLLTLNKNLSDFKNITPPKPLRDLDKLLLPPEAQIQGVLQNESKIKYQEFEDIFHEAEAISSLCAENSNFKVALVVKNEKAKEFYTSFLLQKGCKVQDQFGVNLSKVNITKIIINVSELICSEFSLANLFILLKNPLINSERVARLEIILSGKNRFVSSFTEISKLVEQSGDTNLVEWWNGIAISFEQSVRKQNNFHNLLEISLSVAENLCKSLWQNSYSFETSQFFSELMKLHTNLVLEDTEDFPVILKSLSSSGRVYNHNNSANIIICKPSDALLSRYDLVILADFSEGNWPSTLQPSTWINKSMEDELRLYSNRIKISSNLYQFYELLQNENVIITRSIKQMNNKELLSSRYLMQLLHVAPLIVTDLKFHPKMRPAGHDNDITIQNTVTARKFPNSLSVTDIEMLIRSPYSFYAKKILRLKKQDSIAQSPKLSEFGSFIHNVIEHYTKNYQSVIEDKVYALLGICNQMLESTLLPEYTKKTWRVKFKAVACAFVNFDEELRALNISTYSEIRGKMQVKILDQNIKITAIADRIEVDDQGHATILDYKTGALPTKNDVLNGLSPQLILEAIILINNGFNIRTNNVKKLVYVKIASSEPFIQKVEIDIDAKELDNHFKGLTSLLEYYVDCKIFSTDIDLSKYNDYIHLARKL